MKSVKENHYKERLFVMRYTFRRTKLSALYKEIGRYLRENGDADIRSIVSLNGDSEASYRLELSDINSFDTQRVGEVKVKYEDVQYTKEEWESGIIDISKSNVKKTVFKGLREISKEILANYPRPMDVAPAHIVTYAMRNGIYEDDKVLIIATNEGCDIKSWEFEIEWKIKQYKE